MFGKNWTTTLPGIGAILTAVGNILAGLTINPGLIDWPSNIGTIIAGVGLIFAKSHNVTGGSVVQPTPVEASLVKMDEQATQGLVAPGVVAASKHVKKDLASREPAL